MTMKYEKKTVIHDSGLVSPSLSSPVPYHRRSDVFSFLLTFFCVAQYSMLYPAEPYCMCVDFDLISPDVH